MQSAKVRFDTVAILSRMTGQELSPQNFCPLVIFIAALILVLMGVMVIDKTVAKVELQRLHKTLNLFLPSKEGDVRQITRRLLRGAKQQEIYLNPNALLALTAAFSESQKILLIALGYQMSAVDGDMDLRERMYLQSIANRLGLKPQIQTVLEAGFSGAVADSDALAETRALLDPTKFRFLDAVFVRVAQEILAALPEE